jgi:NAD-dependent SIR2 family protein deacetylase
VNNRRDTSPPVEQADRLARFLDRHGRLFVLTGAGISTGSGIPAYRDEYGEWRRPTPVQYRDFVRSHPTRQRYWARSLVGWPAFERARPNRCHRVLADWEHSGFLKQIVTQNVDRLHQSAGSRQVIDLHGRLDRVICIDCGQRRPRGSFQHQLQTLNPAYASLSAAAGPDGDAFLDELSFDDVVVPACASCGGMLKPDVVFFGETIARSVVDAAIEALAAADALLIIGSSLMVYSGYRFCRLAAEQGKPIVAITPGRTRADDLLTFKVSARFEAVLDALVPGGVSPYRPGDLHRSSR